VERIKLQAEKRDTKTKGDVRQLRLKGKVPAVLYGRKREPLTLIVKEADILKAMSTKAGLNVLLDLVVEGEKPTTVLLRDYQAHPVHRTFTHVDFQAIDMTEKIVVEVPIILNGLAVGVKEGGILEQLLRKIELKCLPTQIPEKIEIDVEHLKIGDSIHSDELKLPEGAEFPRAMKYAIATVVPPAKEEVAAAAVPVEGAVPAEGEAAAPAAEGAAAAPGAAPAKGAAPGAAPAKGAAPGAAPAKGAAPAAPEAKGGEKAKK
jgi:large subunit ribosomal protein L25